MTQKIINAALALGLIALFGWSALGLGHASGLSSVNAYEALVKWFGNGIYVGQSQQFAVSSSGAVTIGASGTSIAQSIDTTCNLAFPSVSFTASTTAQFICPVTGILAGDRIQAELPIGAGANAIGAGSTFGGFSVTAAYATTTGIVGITLANNTGASTSTFPQATTSIHITATR